MAHAAAFESEGESLGTDMLELDEEGAEENIVDRKD